MNPEPAGGRGLCGTDALDDGGDGWWCAWLCEYEWAVTGAFDAARAVLAGCWPLPGTAAVAVVVVAAAVGAYDIGCFPWARELGGGFAEMFSFVAARAAGMALAERGGRFVKSTVAVGRPLPFSGADSGAEFAERVFGGGAELGTEGATEASAGFLTESFLFFPLFGLVVSAAITGSGGRLVLLVLVLMSVAFCGPFPGPAGDRAAVSP